jgi:hypothetical protein
MEVVGYVAFGFFKSEPWHVITHGDPLVEGFHDGKLHHPTQIGLTGEDEDEGVIGIHFEVSEQSEFFEGSGLNEMSFVDDEKYGLSRTFFGFEQGPLDLAIEGTFREP